jgi:hypothetical protein
VAAAEENKCQYCGKLFRRLTTLSAHLCEPKRRALQERDVGVQIGLRSWQRFLDLNTYGGGRVYADFSASPYYSAFVKFGQYCVSIRAINVESYLDWLLRNNRRLDHWCRDSYYEEWLWEYLRREPAQDALERGVREISSYIDQNKDVRHISHYFRYAGANRVCQHIVDGRVSPWLIYNCDSGHQFLEQLNNQQAQLVWRWIDPDHWQKLFLDCPEDAAWTRSVLTAAGF